MFWTVPISARSVQVDPGKATAEYQVTNLPIQDFGMLANAFFGGSSVPATVSFDLHWQMLAVTARKQTKVRDTTQGFAGEFWESEAPGAATLAWSASETGFAFVSDPANTSNSYYAGLGHERNGVFFPQGVTASTRAPTTYGARRGLKRGVLP